MASTRTRAVAASAAPAEEVKEIPVATPDTNATMPDTNVSKLEKKHRVKKVIRSIEELHDVAAKKMNPDEAAKYIDFMRDECTQLQGQLQCMTKNAQSSYEQYNRTATELNNAKRKFAGEIAFAKQAVSTCYAAVLRTETPDLSQYTPGATCQQTYSKREG